MDLYFLTMTRFSTSVRESQTRFNIISPATPQDHYTLGFTRILSPTLDLNTNFMYAPKVSVSGNNQFNPSQRIPVFMSQYEFGASLNWKLA